MCISKINLSNLIKLSIFLNPFITTIFFININLFFTDTLQGHLVKKLDRLHNYQHAYALEIVY